MKGLKQETSQVEIRIIQMRDGDLNQVRNKRGGVRRSEFALVFDDRAGWIY